MPKTIEFRPIQPGVLTRLGECAAEVMARPLLEGAEDLPTIADDPMAQSMIFDGELVASGGIADYGDVAYAWAVFAQPMPKQAVLPLIRRLALMLEQSPLKCIEALTPLDMPSSMKLDQMLGFEKVGLFVLNDREFQRFRYRK
jgi:hypothetical protein